MLLFAETARLQGTISETIAKNEKTLAHSEGLFIFEVPNRFQFSGADDCGEDRDYADSEYSVPSFPILQACAGICWRRASYQRASSTRFQSPSLS